jgi:diadenosine tetraphosphate (Ap4A) HIT family hydrolase
MNGFVLHERLQADSIFIGDLALSQLRLNNVKSVPWLILVPRRPDVREIYQLDAADRTALIEEIAQASRALDALYAPDKINVAALGNQVPQLHVHVIARFTGDAAWPDPVWGKVTMEPYELKAIAEIKEKLNNTKFWA